MSTPKILLVALGLAISSTAQGDESKCCCTTCDTSVCLSRIEKEIDAVLNGTYQKALKAVKESYTAQDLQNLEEAERKWIAYRETRYARWSMTCGAEAAVVPMVTSCV